MELSGSLSVLVPLLSWNFLPQVLTTVLLNALYSLGVLGRPQMQRQAWLHAQSARAVCVLAYLAYSLRQTVVTLPPSYYQVLGLPLGIEGEDTKRAFRALARKFHPDKVGPQGEAIFITLRNAHDVLSDPVKRFAYDRFGPEVAQWRDCATIKEHLLKGLKGCLGFYVVNPVIYAIVSFFGGKRHGGGGYFWRLALLMLMFSVELSLVTSSTYPTILSLLMPNTTIHSVVTLMHSFFTTLLLASQQLNPILAPPQAEDELETLHQLSSRLDAASNHLVVESLRALADETRPLRTPPKDDAETVQAAAARITGQAPPKAWNKQEETAQHLMTTELARRKLSTLL